MRQWLLVAVLFFSGCSNREPLYQQQLFVFGTLVDVTILGVESGQARDAVNDVAAATALTIAGPMDWPRIAMQMGIKYVMLVDEKGTVYMNPAMAKRVHFESENKPAIVISEPR